MATKELDGWKLSDDYPDEYGDWREEVANRNTLLSFSMWCLVNRPRVHQALRS